MRAQLTAEMAVWVPEDAAIGAVPPQAPVHPDEATSLRSLQLCGTVLAISLLSALSAGVMSMFGTI